MTAGVETRRLSAEAARRDLDGLTDVLFDCVEGGASVGYMAPFTRADARREFSRFVDEVEHDRRVLLAAYDGDRAVGTVQVVLSLPPNQPHRAEITKLLVHRDARRRGIARALMEHAEEEARRLGRTLLLLDTVTGSTAERLYERLGWNRLGVVPNFALYPDGRPCDSTFFWKAI